MQLSSEEMLAGAELAGVARVLKVRNTPVGRVARLRFEQVTKGRFQGSRAARHWSRLSGLVTIRLRKATRGPDGSPTPGEWSDRVDPGERVMIYLRWDPGAATYCTIAPNAICTVAG